MMTMVNNHSFILQEQHLKRYAQENEVTSLVKSIDSRPCFFLNLDMCDQSYFSSCSSMMIFHVFVTVTTFIVGSFYTLLSFSYLSLLYFNVLDSYYNRSCIQYHRQ
jgi:hypothetical protein